MATIGEGRKTMRGILIALAVINIIFLVVGFIILVYVVQASLVQNLAQSRVGALERFIPTLTTSLHITDAKAPPEPLVADFDMAVSGLAVGSILFGSLLIILAVFGFCAVWQRVRFLLITYIIILCIVLLVQVLIIVLLFGGTFNDNLHAYLKKSLQEEFGGIDSYNLESVMWNYFMLNMKCCGLNSYSDFDAAQKWDRDRPVLRGSSTVNMRLTTPIACCYLMGDSYRGYKVTDPKCAETPENANSNWKTGCWPVIEESFKKYRGVGIGLGIIIILIEIVTFALAILVVFNTGRTDVRGKVINGDVHNVRDGVFPGDDLADLSFASLDSQTPTEYWPQFPAAPYGSVTNSATPDWYVPERSFGRVPAHVSSGRPDVFYKAKINRPLRPL